MTLKMKEGLVTTVLLTVVSLAIITCIVTSQTYRNWIAVPPEKLGPQATTTQPAGTFQTCESPSYCELASPSRIKIYSPPKDCDVGTLFGPVVVIWSEGPIKIESFLQDTYMAIDPLTTKTKHDAQVPNR